MQKGFYYCENEVMLVWDMTTNQDLLDRKPDTAIPLHEAMDFLRVRGVHTDNVGYGITGFFGGASRNFCWELSVVTDD